MLIPKSYDSQTEIFVFLLDTLCDINTLLFKHIQLVLHVGSVTFTSI
jgi:hypothetical protein